MTVNAGETFCAEQIWILWTDVSRFCLHSIVLCRKAQVSHVSLISMRASFQEEVLGFYVSMNYSLRAVSR